MDGYQCICKAGTSGPNCEINVNECYSNPCRNNAKCIDGINRSVVITEITKLYDVKEFKFNPDFFL